MATTTITLYAHAAGTNTANGTPLAKLAADVAVVLDAPPAGLAVVAVASAPVAAVVFEVDGDARSRRSESRPPYALAGDRDGKFNASPLLAQGPHVVRAWGFDRAEDAKLFADGGVPTTTAAVAEVSIALVVIPTTAAAGETGPRGWRLPVDAEGWTIFPLDRDAGRARHVYVSRSSGSDASAGTLQCPVSELARAMELLEPGKQNVLWLLRGDAWREPFPTLPRTRGGKGPRLGGVDAGRPLIVQAWGPPDAPRPQVLPTDKIGCHQANVNWLVFHGISFRAGGRMPGDEPFRPDRGTAGLLCFKGCRGIWLEDCELLGARNNCTFGGGGSLLVLRRCVVAGNYSHDPLLHSQGLYCDEGADGIWIEQNLFDHNGWLRPQDRTAQRPPDAACGKATIYNHAIYLCGDCGDDVTVVGNVFAEPSSHGLQARSGGVVEDNLFMRCPTGMSFGLVNGEGPVHAGGVRGRVTGNVFIGTRDINGDPRGTGLLLDNIAPGPPGERTIVAGNVFARALDAAVCPTGPAVLLLAGVGRDQQRTVGLNDLWIDGNVIYRWADGVRVDGNLRPGGSGPGSLNRVSVGKNPAVKGKSPARPDPERRAPAELIAACRRQCRGAWRTDVTASAVVRSIREAFGMGGASPPE